MSDYPMLISNKLHSFRNFPEQRYILWREAKKSINLFGVYPYIFLSLQRFLRKAPRSLDYGVMVAQQVLVLFVQVRILVVQRTKNALRISLGAFFFYLIHTKSE